MNPIKYKSIYCRVIKQIKAFLTLLVYLMLLCCCHSQSGKYFKLIFIIFTQIFSLLMISCCNPTSKYILHSQCWWVNMLLKKLWRVFELRVKTVSSYLAFLCVKADLFNRRFIVPETY